MNLKFREAHLRIEPFNEEIKRNIGNRDRRKDLDTGGVVRYGVRTENERISNVLDQCEGLDYSEANMQMYHFPDWKDITKERWITSKGYRHRVARLPMGKSAWSTMPLRETADDFNKYEGGLQEVGERITFRRRLPEFESDKNNEFTQWNRPDLWDSTGHTSQSLRTKVNDRIMKLEPVYDKFSENDHLEYYKQNLISTKNLDRIIPFRHSNNYKGDAMTKLRPMQNKLHPKTANEQLRRAHLVQKHGPTFKPLKYGHQSSMHDETKPYSGVTGTGMKRVKSMNYEVFPIKSKKLGGQIPDDEKFERAFTKSGAVHNNYGIEGNSGWAVAGESELSGKDAGRGISKHHCTSSMHLKKKLPGKRVNEAEFIESTLKKYFKA
jgi:hypothetical protein